jgi:hypothetical protein
MKDEKLVFLQIIFSNLGLLHGRQVSIESLKAHIGLLMVGPIKDDLGRRHCADREVEFILHDRVEGFADRTVRIVIRRGLLKEVANAGEEMLFLGSDGAKSFGEATPPVMNKR